MNKSESEKVVEGEIVLCDIEYSNKFVNHSEIDAYLKQKTPRPKPSVPCTVLNKYNHCMRLEVVNETSKGEVDYSNTDKFGSMVVVFNDCIERIESPKKS